MELLRGGAVLSWESALLQLGAQPRKRILYKPPLQKSALSKSQVEVLPVNHRISPPRFLSPMTVMPSAPLYPGPNHRHASSMPAPFPRQKPNTRKREKKNEAHHQELPFKS